MYKTFVLINCESGKEPEILNQLKKMKNVIDTQGTYGIYDIIASIKSDNQSQLDNIISNQIRKISNIKSTITLIPTKRHQSDLPDLIPDIIPEQKKPLKDPSSENDEDDLDEDDLDEDDYDESTS